MYATRSKNAPAWSSYNSVLNHSQPLTKVSMSPLIAAPSHEFSTLLTIFRQAERIKTMVVGANQKIVITLGFTNQQNSWNMLQNVVKVNGSFDQESCTQSWLN